MSSIDGSFLKNRKREKSYNPTGTCWVGMQKRPEKSVHGVPRKEEAVSEKAVVVLDVIKLSLFLWTAHDKLLGKEVVMYELWHHTT